MLRSNAVSYVAVAPGTRRGPVARAEADLVLDRRSGAAPDLERPNVGALRGDRPAPLVAAPATLVASDRGGVTFDAPAGEDVLVRVRWSRWLTLDGGAGTLTRGPDGWTSLHLAGPGRYRLTSAL